ncbi:MAG: glutathione S-transferase family protein [Myxococcota bacterium]
MAAPYRIFGSELSPYSVKVRSYFRYKGISHEWLERGPTNIAEYQKYAKLPLIPLVVTPESQGLQDSTPILEAIEARLPEPSVHPSDPTLAFLSALVEEFGDEWGNKWMFHYRWARPVDQDSGAERIARSMRPDATADELAQLAAGVKERMLGRVGFVGSSPTTAPLIEASYRDALKILEKHLAARPYLFGARPAFGDFGLWGQLYECWTDPTPGAMLRKEAPRVTAFVERMLEPKAEGDFESWDALAPTLLPLLERQVGLLFLPWSDANARAIAAGQEEMSARTPVGLWTQKPQKYHARSLAELRKKYAAVPDKGTLDPILERASCLRWLQSGA